MSFISIIGQFYRVYKINEKDRYCNLPYPSKKLKFVNLQMELFTEFHLRLCQIIRNETKNQLGKIYLGVLNTVNYVIYVLDEWKNTSVTHKS